MYSLAKTGRARTAGGRLGVIVWLLFMLACNGPLLAAKSPKEPVTDLRVLVDVSGSMKQNDPNNLRRVALRLLIGMLPEDSRAGLWSFGQYVNMQVKPGFADKTWKQAARKEASTIHSLGLYTNIEDTLRKSSWDWKNPDPAWDRHMILLTDGMVDISKDPAKDAASRQRILDEVVKQFKDAGVKVHTIALSQQADHELLSKLSRETDGWYEAVESADSLQRLFLRLFEKTTKMDSLPLDDNGFDVDASISDMTLLIFRKPGAKPTRVILPDTSVIAKDKLPANVEWHSDKGFDIITVHKPLPGSWKIDAEQDKDNRVKVITNLKLKVDPLPTNVLLNEAVNLKASLQQKDGLLDDKAILNLVEMKLVNSRTGEQPVLASDSAGYYEARVDGLGEEGDIEVIVRAMAPTFKRESRFEIKVHDNPVKLAIGRQGDYHVITVTEAPEIIQTGTLQLALRIEGIKGSYHVPKAGEHSWQAAIDKSYSGRAISIDAKAKLLGNRDFATTLQGRFPEEEKTVDPLTVWAEKTEQGMAIKVIPMEGILQTGTLQLTYRGADEQPSEAVVISIAGKDIWLQDLPGKYSGKEIIVHATAYQLDGKAFDKDYPLAISEFAESVKADINPYALDDKALAEKQAEAEKLAKQDADTTQPDADDNNTEIMHEDEPAKTSWWLVVVILVLVNGSIIGGGYFGYRYWKRRNGPVDENLNEESAEEMEQVEFAMAASSGSDNTDKEASPLTVSSNESNSGNDYAAERRSDDSAVLEVDLGNTDDIPVASESQEVDAVNIDDEELPEFEVTDDDAIPELDMADEIDAAKGNDELESLQGKKDKGESGESETDK